MDKTRNKKGESQMRKLLSVIFVMVFLVGCGSSKEGTEAAQQVESNFYSQYESGNCGLDVVSDYNSAVGDCRRMYSRSDIEKCEDKLILFKSKYPRINCSVEEGYGLDKETFVISESYIDRLIKEVQNM